MTMILSLFPIHLFNLLYKFLSLYSIHYLSFIYSFIVLFIIHTSLTFSREWCITIFNHCPLSGEGTQDDVVDGISGFPPSDNEGGSYISKPERCAIWRATCSLWYSHVPQPLSSLTVEALDLGETVEEESSFCSAVF